jgi:hypothetical protein
MPIFEKRVVSGLDDVEQAASGAMSLTSGDLNLVNDGTRVQTVGIRFTNIDIPQGAIITSAYLQFQTDQVSSGATSLLIWGEDADDTAAFANVANNVSSRTKTDAAASWSPAAWTTVGEAGLAQRTPDLSAIVQEIVSRSGWSALNDMAFIITGTGTRTAEASRSLRMVLQSAVLAVGAYLVIHQEATAGLMVAASCAPRSVYGNGEVDR